MYIHIIFEAACNIDFGKNNTFFRVNSNMLIMHLKKDCTVTKLVSNNRKGQTNVQLYLNIY